MDHASQSPPAGEGIRPELDPPTAPARSGGTVAAKREAGGTGGYVHVAPRRSIGDNPPSVKRSLFITANILGAAVLLALAVNPHRPLLPVFALLVVAVACAVAAWVRWR